MVRRIGLASLLTFTGLALAAPTGALAATTIGQNGPAIDNCIDERASVQVQVASGPDYTPSAPGVITSWSAAASATPNETLKLLVLEPNPFGGPNHFITVQKDELRTLPLASQLNTFTGLHLPIQPGQRLGLYIPVQTDGGGPCMFIATGAEMLKLTTADGEPVLGQSTSYDGGPITTRRLNASALVEPDADHDGFGDETQDQCPTDAATQGPCPVTPVTPAKKKKCKKHKKHRSAESAKKKKCKKKKHR